jgi:hypothetical protein
MDIVRVQVKAKSRNTKTAPASRRRFVMKYSGTLNARVEKILVGSSQIIDDIASVKG